jgi:hypothetical protein
MSLFFFLFIMYQFILTIFFKKHTIIFNHDFLKYIILNHDIYQNVLFHQKNLIQLVLSFFFQTVLDLFL